MVSGQKGVQLFQERLPQVQISPYWQRAEIGTVSRHPTFCLRPPSTEELAEAFRQPRTYVAAYELFVDATHPANGCVYVCTDRDYSLERLSSTMRRNVRRGMQSLRLDSLTIDEVLTHGVEAFCDTRQRVGVGDGTPELFRKRFETQRDKPQFAYLGSWDGDYLASFLAIDLGDNWAEISGCFSRNASLSLRPNDTLMYFALHRYLVEERRQAVAYGASSVQLETNEDTLHVFKQKVGFEAIPVHRSFAVHGLVRPMVNRLSLKVLRALLRIRPRDRVLKKAEGMLSTMLDDACLEESIPELRVPD